MVFNDIFISFLEAAEIAFDQMLQEDFAHPITRYLSWYACHMFWKHGEPAPAPEPPEDDGVSIGQVTVVVTLASMLRRLIKD